MSKSNRLRLTLPRTGGARKFLALLVLAVVIALVVRDPHGSAETARAIGHGIGKALDALATFAHSIGN